MKIIGRNGNDYLVLTSGPDLSGIKDVSAEQQLKQRGVVANILTGDVSDELLLQQYFKFGYWDPYEASANENKKIFDLINKV